MFPILPVLILLLLGPANAERLAVEGRLPATLLAVHRAMAPTAVFAAVEETEAPEPTIRPTRRIVRTEQAATFDGDFRVTPGFNWSCPTRAGPAIG